MVMSALLGVSVMIACALHVAAFIRIMQPWTSAAQKSNMPVEPAALGISAAKNAAIDNVL
jgi:hypothetical protein